VWVNGVLTSPPGGDRRARQKFMARGVSIRRTTTHYLDDDRPARRRHHSIRHRRRHGHRRRYFPSRRAGGRLAVRLRAVPMQDGEVVAGGIVEQSHVAIQNLIAILPTAATDRSVCGAACGSTTRGLQSFRLVPRVLRANPPARACVMSSMVVTARWRSSAWRLEDESGDAGVRGWNMSQCPGRRSRSGICTFPRRYERETAGPGSIGWQIEPPNFCGQFRLAFALRRCRSRQADQVRRRRHGA
jgi:hypothetical protein